MFVQRFQCCNCKKYLVKSDDSFNWKPYCENCNTLWEIIIKPEDLKIEYKNLGEK